MSEAIDLAVLGGSGFYEMPGLRGVGELRVDTPYGAPSDVIRAGELEGRRVAFLARHGPGHRLLPSELPQRANLWALKALGARRVLAVSAVGSLREDYRPRHLAVPDQLIDRTRGDRPATFFGDGVVAHVAFADPFCAGLRADALAAARMAGATVHDGGAYVAVEGPAFGTRAESELHRAWGAALVGMTALPEARLAREAELCYAMLAAVTDYDAWRPGEEGVDAAAVFETLRENVERCRRAVRLLAAMLDAGEPSCPCTRALDAALVTPPAALAPAARERLAPILRRRLGAGA